MFDCLLTMAQEGDLLLVDGGGRGQTQQLCQVLEFAESKGISWPGTPIGPSINFENFNWFSRNMIAVWQKKGSVVLANHIPP